MCSYSLSADEACDEICLLLLLHRRRVVLAVRSDTPDKPCVVKVFDNDLSATDTQRGTTTYHDRCTITRITPTSTVVVPQVFKPHSCPAHLVSFKPTSRSGLRYPGRVGGIQCTHRRALHRALLSGRRPRSPLRFVGMLQGTRSRFFRPPLVNLEIPTLLNASLGKHRPSFGIVSRTIAHGTARHGVVQDWNQAEPRCGLFRHEFVGTSEWCSHSFVLETDAENEDQRWSSRGTSLKWTCPWPVRPR